MDTGYKWNVGGVIVGIILGLFAIFGIVASQTASAGDPGFNSVVSYNDPS
jgi:hypothetical protein